MPPQQAVTLESRLTFPELSFETIVMKGLAADGGLFLPEEIPFVTDWVRSFGSQSLA